MRSCLILLRTFAGLHRKALEVWSRLGSGEFRDADSTCDGVKETVALLGQLPDDPLLWHFAEWVLRINPKEGLKIFSSSARPSSATLPHDKVLTFLQGVMADTTALMESGVGVGGVEQPPLDLVEAYLEHLVFVEKTTERAFHDQLAQLYMKTVDALALCVHAIIH